MTAGCLFDSGGRPGSCSATPGVLINSEIDRFLARSSGRTTLDRQAAVKIHTSGDQWITYDDEQTFQMKVDFARGQCMGGVMVWALSQDNPDGRYSRALQKATQYHSPGTRLWESNLGEMAGPGTTIPRDQCRWTNCGQGCPRGWQPVPRRDVNARPHEVMRDDTACEGHGSRTFCCPSGIMPVCQWLHFNGGNCNSECTSGFEVGSYGGACNNGKSQLACCTTRGHSYFPGEGQRVEAMNIWDKCRWIGNEFGCGAAEGYDCGDVSGGRRNLLTKTYRGSGSIHCKGGGSSTRGKLPQAYCCQAESQSSRWEDCIWYGDRDSLAKGGDGHCQARCPEGYSKIGLDDDKDHCKTGSRARCCRAFVRTAARSPAESLEHLEAVMRQWTANPVCPLEQPFGNLLSATASGSENATRVLDARQADRSAPAVMENALVYMLSNDPETDAAKPTFNLWNRIVASEWSSLTSDTVLDIFAGSPAIRSVVKMDKAGYANSLLCRMGEWDDFVRGGGLDRARIQCDLSILLSKDPDLFEDPDDGGVGGSRLGDTIRDNPWLIGNDRVGVLGPRAGKASQYPVDINGVGRVHLTSQPYINGANGQNLASANGDSSRIYLTGSGSNCDMGIVEEDGDENIVVHCKSNQNPASVSFPDDTTLTPEAAEHIIEQQTVGRFLEFAFNGQLPPLPPLNDPHASHRPNLDTPMMNPTRAVPTYLWSYMDRSFRGFAAAFEPGSTPVSEMYEVIGSVRNSHLMVNTHDVLNGMKARVWGLRNPVAPTRWLREFGEADELHIMGASTQIRVVRFQLPIQGPGSAVLTQTYLTDPWHVQLPEPSTHSRQHGRY